MGWRKAASQKLTLLALIWLAITLSLVGWWWYHALSSFASDERLQRMFLWEGGFLFAVLFVGGAGLVYLTYHHQSRHERLRMFFATFAHDLKTSISRLRLQGELLEESGSGVVDHKVKSILRDIHKIDLQLENSLWMAQLESNSLLIQPVRISDAMEHLRNEFSEMQFEISHDAKVFVDRRAFAVILRNLFSNASLHGGADRIQLKVHVEKQSRIHISIEDNGSGIKNPIEKMGTEILSGGHEKSNGLGLYLSRRLMERMNGEMTFHQDPRFRIVLHMRGDLS